MAGHMECQQITLLLTGVMYVRKYGLMVCGIPGVFHLTMKPNNYLRVMWGKTNMRKLILSIKVEIMAGGSKKVSIIMICKTAPRKVTLLIQYMSMTMTRE